MILKVGWIVSPCCVYSKLNYRQTTNLCGRWSKSLGRSWPHKQVKGHAVSVAEGVEVTVQGSRVRLICCRWPVVSGGADRWAGGERWGDGLGASDVRRQRRKLTDQIPLHARQTLPASTERHGRGETRTLHVGCVIQKETVEDHLIISLVKFWIDWHVSVCR